MNINEIENLTGLTRANIRFYEKEGLIEVARLPNGYRDYSQENIDDLKRIVLLRRLQFTIEEIRQAKNGERGLDELLTEKEAQIAEQLGELEAAMAVCSEMLADKVSYADMDAGKYLSRIEDRKKIIENDVPKGSGHSGRRFLALVADHILCNYVLSNAIIMFTGYTYVMSGMGGTFIKWALCILMTCLLEPLFLHLFAATPGKLIFGLRVYEESGRKLTYREGFERTFKRLENGEGFRIPIYRIYKLYESYKSCDKLEVMEWDSNTKYEVREMSWKNFISGAVYIAMCVVLALTVMFFGIMPKNKGDITPAQFTENFNKTAKSKNYGMRIEDGGDGTFIWKADVPAGVINFDSDKPKNLYYKTKDGFVTEVGYSYDDGDNVWSLTRSRVEYLSMWSLLMGRESVFTFSDMQDFISDSSEYELEDAVYTYENVTVVRSISDDMEVKWHVRLE